MTRAAHEHLRIAAPLALVSLASWFALTAWSFVMTVPGICVVEQGGSVNALTHWWYAAPDIVGTILAFNPPFAIAGAWALMFVAMMTPLLLRPLTHVYARSFRARRARSMALFTAGYAAIWLIAGTILVTLALLFYSALGAFALPLTLSAVVLWQMSPAKQYCLNRCHTESELAAFGAAADRDALRYGLKHGSWCAGSCWGLMLLPMLVEHGHLAAMILGAFWGFAERYERPVPLTWRWRWPAKLVRLALEQLRALPHIIGGEDA